MCVELSGQKQSAGVLASIGGKSEGKLSGYYPRDFKLSADDIHTVNMMSAQIIEMSVNVTKMTVFFYYSHLDHHTAQSNSLDTLPRLDLRLCASDLFSVTVGFLQGG